MAKIKNELKGLQSIPRNLIFDNSISDRARFVYCFMVAKPDDWDFFLDPMARELGYSVETLRKYINELVANGWLVKEGQSNHDGKFGSVKYTIKANKVFPCTENTVSENFRDGKNTTQHNIDYLQNKDNIHKQDNKEKEYKEKFKSFVSLYKKMGGKARGIDTEFNDFTKRHKDWKEILPYLSLAVQRETKARQQAKIEKKFFPEPKMLQTYLGKQRAWELYVTIGEDVDTNEYNPICDVSLNWNDYYKCYIYTGYWNGYIPDGYTDENRPNGAMVTLNNGRGTKVWNKEKKIWEDIKPR